MVHWVFSIEISMNVENKQKLQRLSFLMIHWIPIALNQKALKKSYDTKFMKISKWYRALDLALNQPSLEKTVS